MGFVRQSINNTSTFTTGEEVVPISTPTFRIWDNTTSDIRYDLGSGWSINLPNDELSLNFSLNGEIVWEVNNFGEIIDPVLILKNYADDSEIIDLYNQSGLLARIDGELYMSEAFGP